MAAGPVEEMGRKHMSLYFSYRFKHRADFYERQPYTAAPPEEQKYLHVTQETLIDFLERLKMGARESFPLDRPGENRHLLSPQTRRDEVMAPDFDPAQAAEKFQKNWATQGVLLANKRQLDVARGIDTRAVTLEIETFFDRYLHDSMAGFIGMGMNEFALNHIGFAKFRTVFKGND